jgi:uncharacterized membrane protein
MSMRLSEIHPSLVHFPLALLPIAVGADTIGNATGNRELNYAGKLAIAGAAISASVAGLFGLIAQEEVSLDNEGEKILLTHRTLNVGTLAVLTAMAVYRASRRKPSGGYLVAGFSALAVTLFSAYLGGKLVYDHGAGVKRVGAGTSDPEITRHNTAIAAGQAARDLGRGIKHTAEDARRGEFLPALKPRKWWS